MKEQVARLLEAARVLKGLNSPTAVARALNISPQALSNWAERGISKSGRLQAEQIIGCSATWLLNGKGDMAAASPTYKITTAKKHRVAEIDDDYVLYATITEAVCDIQEEWEALTTGKKAAIIKLLTLESATTRLSKDDILARIQAMLALVNE